MGRYFLILLIASLFPPTFLAYSLSPSRSLSLALSSLAQFLFATSPAARKFLILRTAHLSLVATSLLRGTIQLQYTTLVTIAPCYFCRGCKYFGFKTGSAPPLEGSLLINDNPIWPLEVHISPVSKFFTTLFIDSLDHLARKCATVRSTSIHHVQKDFLKICYHCG